MIKIFNKLLKIIKKLIMSFFMLYGYNVIAPTTAIIPINIITISLITIFSIPAIIFLIIIRLVIY